MIYYFYLTACHYVGTGRYHIAEVFRRVYQTASHRMLLHPVRFLLFQPVQGTEWAESGVAYATWCGVGIVASALISAFIFRQGLTILGILGVVLIVTGCIVLNLSGAAH